MRGGILALSALLLAAGCATGGGLRGSRSVPRAAQAQAHFAAGVHAITHSEYATAIEELEEAARLDPEAPRIRMKLSEAHLRAGHRRAAVDTARRAAELAPGDSDIRLYLAALYLQMKRLGDAR